MDNFKKRRIEYLNNWPNSEPFEIEKKYFDLVRMVKGKNGTIFQPFPLLENEDTIYNKTISLIIESLELLEKYPNLSFEIIFRAYDGFSKKYHDNISSITDKIKKLCDYEIKEIILSTPALKDAFLGFMSFIPITACQYVYKRLNEKKNSNNPYNRLTKGISGEETSATIKRKNIIDGIIAKYGYNSKDYSNTVRKGSTFIRYFLSHEEVEIECKDNTTKYESTIEDKLHFIFSGLLYTLRNDIMHGESISINKSSKTTLKTYSCSYYAYLVLYYFLIVLIIDSNKNAYPPTIYDDLALNINKNKDLFEELFGKSIEQ